jgi:hypothetical protein
LICNAALRFFAPRSYGRGVLFQGLDLESRWTRRNLAPYNLNAFAIAALFWESGAGNA